jgi:energy-converting hydrogenase Eha subunit A
MVFMQVAEPSSSLEIRHRWETFAVFYLLWIPLGIAVGSTVMKISLEATIGGAILGAIAGVVTAIVMAWALDKVTPVHASAQGLQAYDFFGRRSVVDWSQVTRTRNLTLWPGVRWILLDDGRRFTRCTLLPTFVKNAPSVMEAIATFAGDEHPVTLALARQGCLPTTKSTAS